MIFETINERWRSRNPDIYLKTKLLTLVSAPRERYDDIWLLGA